MKNITQKKIGFVSLGCDKNRVDLEKIIYDFKKNGFEISNNQNEAQVIVINTCGFICDAKRESINTILDIAKLKQSKLEKLVVCGCLCNEMNIKELEESLPEVDAFVKILDNKNLVSIVQNLYYGSEVKQNKFACGRILTTPNHYAYLKIADGCNNFCTYCLIPHIKGRFKSEKERNILKETKSLCKNGTKELILVAQDTTKFGSDTKGKSLVLLLKKLEKIKQLEKIRLLYCYPDSITPELISEIKRNKKVCKYLDIPLQHISDSILKKMNRHTTKQQIENLIKTLRKEIPEIAIRTTFIVGFPEETEADFKTLCDFIKKFKLDNVGFFKYSREENTPAGKMKNQVPQKIKNERLKTLAKLQFEVVEQRLKKMIGKTIVCTADKHEFENTICHSDFCCPGIDGEIKIINKKIEIGKTISCKVTKADGYDIICEAE